MPIVSSLELLHDTEARTRLIDIFKRHVNNFHMFLETLPESPIFFDRAGLSSPLSMQLLLASILGAGSVLASDDYLKSVGQASIAYAQDIALASTQDTRSLEVFCALSIMMWTELALGRSSMGSIYCREFRQWYVLIYSVKLTLMNKILPHRSLLSWDFTSPTLWMQQVT